MKVKASTYNIRIPIKHGKVLLYNSLSRSMSLLEAEEIEKLDTQLDEPVPDYWDIDMATDWGLRSLLDQGFVLPEEIDELNVVQQLYGQNRFGSRAINLIVCPTLACNFGCDYCFQGQDKSVQKMSPAVQSGIVELYRRIIESKPDLQHVQFIWYGGEPLVKKNIIYDLADELIAICKEKNIGYSAIMVSNGYLLNKEVALELAKRGLHTVQITLDGAEEQHDARRHLLSKKGTYRKILQNIETWIDEVPITVQIRVNIDERNKGDIMNLIDDLEARGLAGKKNFLMYFSPVEAITLGCHNISEKMMQKMNYGRLEALLYRYAYAKRLTNIPYPPAFLGICSALRPNDYIIVPNGDVHKCWDTVSFPDKKIGSVFEIEGIIDKPSPAKLQWDHFDPFANEICRSCKILPNCAGYCAHKFVNAADTAGESILPCPSLKYSLNERLVLKAEMDGFISHEDYDLDDIKTDPYQLTPKMHTVESMKKAAVKHLPIPTAIE